MEIQGITDMKIMLAGFPQMGSISSGRWTVNDVVIIIV